jgi:hypothetical protein
VPVPGTEIVDDVVPIEAERRDDLADIAKRSRLESKMLRAVPLQRSDKMRSRSGLMPSSRAMPRSEQRARNLWKRMTRSRQLASFVI